MTATLRRTKPAAATDVMCWRRTFPGQPEQVRSARRFVAFLLDRRRFADDAVQAVAELAGNAVIHTRSGRPGGGFVVEVRCWPGGLAIAVTDQGHSPELQSITGVPGRGDLAEHGRGLPIVAALAGSVTWSGDARSGSTITATFT